MINDGILPFIRKLAFNCSKSLIALRCILLTTFLLIINFTPITSGWIQTHYRIFIRLWIITCQVYMRWVNSFLFNGTHEMIFVTYSMKIDLRTFYYFFKYEKSMKRSKVEQRSDIRITLFDEKQFRINFFTWTSFAWIEKVESYPWKIVCK